MNDDPNELRRILELQLVKVRSEASAAKLNARAAEIQMMLRRLGHGPAADTVGGSPSPDSFVPEPSIPDFPAPDSLAPDSLAPDSRSPAMRRWDPCHEPRPKGPANPPTTFADWGSVRSAQTNGHSRARAKSDAETDRPRNTPAAADRSVENSPPTSIANRTRREPSRPITRRDGQHSRVGRPRMMDQSRHSPLPQSPVDGGSASQARNRNVQAGDSKIKKNDVGGLPGIEPLVTQDDDDKANRRRRPAAWFVSAIAHVGILILLAGIGLQTRIPKDQVALSASVTSADQEVIETVEIETSQAMPSSTVSDPVPNETQHDLSPVGELVASEFSPDALPTPPTAMVSTLSSSAAGSTLGRSMNSAGAKKMTFCGVEGGGNHFVYMVDSSESMKSGFDSAITALLGSIDLLTPDQRFYVIIFDRQPDYMRISDPSVDEPRSVFATDANKRALKRWVRQVGRGPGWAPYDPTRFALKLRPDVIFLLSDGEFSQKFEDMLAEENVVTNLFGDRKPISIIHTIAYHSKVGEAGMRRIANRHNGQFRYVPKP
ncbi:hypothetical protein K227x_56840 [Rubripirellula lacrimiformis]|uniref:VWFA domain-containing protein n=1 Tax=Rubripirellula lacrimiformis TaxID=1930273 RepID=A0A517NJF7_9BACT|nr:vWA domain-containing protein [Rubripirellula lacrimiformis]QDT07257.1 hypothetical protein K227x_56840 [Rubripirellula lacrimiformis]